MEKVDKPHDKYFKSTFGEVDFAKNFLNSYLPKDFFDILNINTLSRESDTYLTKELKEQFADLVYRVGINDKEAYISFLFEHKSYKDRMVIFQVLKYMLVIWEEKIKNDIANAREIEIPMVIPIVVYHDKYEWNIKESLGEMMPGFKQLPETIKRYIPDFKYLLADISDHNKLKKDLGEEYKIVLETLSRTRYENKENILEIFKRAIEIYEKTKDKDLVSYYIVETIIYILSSRDDIDNSELEKIADKISEEGGDLFMTAAEKLIEKGRLEGEVKGVKGSIQNVLAIKFDIIDLKIKRKIDKIDDLDLLGIILEKAIQIEFLEEFKKYIDTI